MELAPRHWQVVAARRARRHEREYTPLAQRFWEKVRVTSGCWLWLARRNDGGYGEIGLWGTRNRGLAHRVAWLLAEGPIPDGLRVLHKCDVPACVNPDHLFLGTDLDNARDKARKGRTYNRRLQPSLVAELRRQFSLEQITVTEAASRAGVGERHMRDVLMGRVFTWLD